MDKAMKTFKEAWEDEAKERKNIKADELCCYGITALEDSLKFIMKNDLVVIGADSGIGKTELALNLAFFNIMKNRRVAIYNLEGGHTEALARIKWREMCNIYYKDFKGRIENFNYTNWKSNSIKELEVLEKIETQAYDKVCGLANKNLSIYPVSRGFTIENFYQSIIEFHRLEEEPGQFVLKSKFDVDLIIIDHLQYFELTGNENEIKQTTNILRKLKELTDQYYIPVVLISHLRKKNKDRGLPDQEDFYGSSNIPKIASTAITISSNPSGSDHAKNIYSTIFRVVKSRFGIRKEYCFKINFNLNTRMYEDEYSLHLINDEGFFCADPLEKDKCPTWFKTKAQRLIQDVSRWEE